jgi:hypothetical protein
MKPLPLSKKGYANMNGYTNMNQTVKHSDFSETNARLKRDYYDKIDYITLTDDFGNILHQYAPDQFDEALTKYFEYLDDKNEELWFNAYDKDGNNMGIQY